jgi:hypothetical protein
MKNTFNIEARSDEIDNIIADLKSSIPVPNDGSVMEIKGYGIRVITHRSEDATWVKTKYGNRIRAV